KGSYHLAGAFRRLARPSSPLTARASTVYAWSLNLTTRRCFTSDCENLRDSNTHNMCVVSIFSLIQIFKEQNFAVHLFRFTLKFSCVRSKRWWSYAGSNRRPPACKAGALPAEL